MAKLPPVWETMLNAVVSAGFQIVGTWPMRTERSRRPRGQGANALASSIVLVCRPRPADAPVASRRDFLDALKKEMPPALDQFTQEGLSLLWTWHKPLLAPVWRSTPAIAVWRESVGN